MIEKFDNAIKQGILILNVTQCAEGAVNMSLYDTGKKLESIGIISGSDMTFESAYTKLAWLLAQDKCGKTEIQRVLKMAVRAEITP